MKVPAPERWLRRGRMRPRVHFRPTGHCPRPRPRGRPGRCLCPCSHQHPQSWTPGAKVAARHAVQLPSHAETPRRGGRSVGVSQANGSEYHPREPWTSSSCRPAATPCPEPVNAGEPTPLPASAPTHRAGAEGRPRAKRGRGPVNWQPPPPAASASSLGAGQPSSNRNRHDRAMRAPAREVTGTQRTRRLPDDQLMIRDCH